LEEWIINTRLLLLFFLCIINSAAALAEEPATFLRKNGPVWLQFGPGIINDCKRIDLLEYEVGPEKLVLTRKTALVGSKPFPAVQQWLRKNIGTKFSFSEKEAGRKNLTSRAYVVLQSEDNKEWNYEPQFATENMSDIDPKTCRNPHVLLSAPLNETVLGAEWKSLTMELKKLMPAPAIVVPNQLRAH
jgi:hypothetical protein